MHTFLYKLGRAVGLVAMMFGAGLIIGTLIMVLVFMSNAFADDPWANSPYKGWAEKQQVMPEAWHRFGCTLTKDEGGACLCCALGEIVKTKFRAVSNVEDGWEWLDPKSNRWMAVPQDIIHWSEDTPTGEGVIFIRTNGVPACFFPPGPTAQ